MHHWVSNHTVTCYWVALLYCCAQVSDAVVHVIQELEPKWQAIFEVQTADGQTRWSKHLAVDLRLAGGQQLAVAQLLQRLAAAGGF
jgi:hypothetical protein